MTRVVILKNTVADRQVYRVGDTPDLPAEEARKIILMGKAKLFVEKVEVETTPKAEAKASKGKGKGKAVNAETQPEPETTASDNQSELDEGDEPSDPFADDKNQ